MRQTTKVFLNTWGAYNDGCIGYGWMEPEKALDFMKEDPERDGGEWFIADIDNYLGVDFGNLEYCNAEEVIETIQELENMDDDELENVVALMEYTCNTDASYILSRLDNYTFYADLDQYHDCMDELVEMEMPQNSILTRYFDYEAYHRDCDFDIYEASNGVVIWGC